MLAALVGPHMQVRVGPAMSAAAFALFVLFACGVVLHRSRRSR